MKATSLQKAWRYLARIPTRIHTQYLRCCGKLLKIYIGPGTLVWRGAELSTKAGGSITIGANCVIHPGARLLSYRGAIVMGDSCSVNHNCILYGHGGLTIGNGVRIATGCTAIPANHCFADAATPIYLQGETRQGITIGDDVWIAAHCVLLDGITIATGCVIAAGAVVTKSTEPYGIYAGVPARLIKKRE